MLGTEMNAGLDAGPTQLRAMAVVVPCPGSGELLPPLVGSCIYFWLIFFYNKHFGDSEKVHTLSYNGMQGND